jgi:GTP-binding protein LepA
MVPDDYLGAVLTLCNERRGQQAELTYVGNRAMAVYRLPLNEVVFDFYDRLKSVSRGYASFDYAMDGYAEGDLVKISILVNNEPVDALSFMAHRSQAERAARDLRAAEGADPAPALQDPDPGGDRRAGDRARDHLGAVQGRHRQVLRRRHHPQAQAPGEAEGGQEAHAAVRQGRDPAERLHRRAEDGRLTRAATPLFVKRAPAILRVAVALPMQDTGGGPAPAPEPSTSPEEESCPKSPVAP